METRVPQPVHPDDGRTPAVPGELDLLRRFLSLHDHVVDRSDSLEPAADTLAWWLRDRGLVGPGDELSDEDLAWGLTVREALVAKVRENEGEPVAPEEPARLNEAATLAGLHPRFDRPRLAVAASGVRGAIGRLLGIAFLADLDGTWRRFRICADPACAAVFYDRSKNHSAKWCSMQSCGNRNKVRAYRERERRTGAP